LNCSIIYNSNKQLGVSKWSSRFQGGSYSSELDSGTLSENAERDPLKDERLVEHRSGFIPMVREFTTGWFGTFGLFLHILGRTIPTD